MIVSNQSQMASNSFSGSSRLASQSARESKIDFPSQAKQTAGNEKVGLTTHQRSFEAVGHEPTARHVESLAGY
jgi:hypothetical protein